MKRTKLKNGDKIPKHVWLLMHRAHGAWWPFHRVFATRREARHYQKNNLIFASQCKFKIVKYTIDL